MGKDIQTWNELTAEVARLEQENERLRGGDGCEKCNHTDVILDVCCNRDGWGASIRFDNDDYNSLDLLLEHHNGVVEDTTININYCPFCGRKLGGAE